jgi:hypothetical protein
LYVDLLETCVDLIFEQDLRSICSRVFASYRRKLVTE